MFDLSYMVGELRTLVVLVAIFFFYFFAVCTEPRPPPARPQPLAWQNKNSGCSWQRCSVAWLVIYGRPPSPAILITAALLHFEIIQLGI